MCIIVGIAVAARSSEAQVIGGRVLDRTTHLPAGKLDVRVLDDSDRVLARSSTDTAGIFYAQLPAPSHVRVQFQVADGESFLSDPVTVGAQDISEREYLLAIARTYTSVNVEKQVSLVRGTMHLAYPADLKALDIKGQVVASFVVDTTGLMIPETFTVVRTSDGGFVAPVLAALRTARFNPAVADGHKVKQLVQQAFTFDLTSTPTPGLLYRRRPDEPLSGLPPLSTGGP